jgi:hypothetical protein
MPLPLSLLSQLLFREPDRLQRLRDSDQPHERWLALAAQGDAPTLRQELFWAMGGTSSTYPFAKTDVSLDGEHKISAAAAALVVGDLDCLKLLVSTQRLNPAALGEVFEQAAFVWQRSQTESPDPLLRLSEDQKTCIAWLMTRGLELRDHLPSFAIHERTSGGSIIKRTGDMADPRLETFILAQAEHTLTLYNELRDIQQELAPDSHVPRLTEAESVKEAWALIGHTFLRWRLADQARRWLSQSESLPFYPGVHQPSYLERNFRHRDLVEELLDRRVPLDDTRALELIRHVRNDQKSREAQWKQGFKLRKGAARTPHQQTQWLEQEIQIQENTLEVMALVDRYQQLRSPAWAPSIQREWALLSHQVSNRLADLDDEITAGLRVANGVDGAWSPSLAHAVIAESQRLAAPELAVEAAAPPSPLRRSRRSP